MRVSLTLGRTVTVHKPVRGVPIYKFPDLSSIHAHDLPNNGFGKSNYYIKKTKFGHWPVYKKVQNTKITTEIKRIEGDVEQFKRDLLKAIPTLTPKMVAVNKTAGYVNVKGDNTDVIKHVLSENIQI